MTATLLFSMLNAPQFLIEHRIKEHQCESVAKIFKRELSKFGNQSDTFPHTEQPDAL